MGDKNSSVSTALLALATICSFFLFGGLFSARWEYVVENYWESAFVLVLGTLIPLLCIASVVFAVKGFNRYESSPRSMKIVALFCILWLVIFYFMSTMTSVIELYKIKLVI